ncbi:MAG: hypothetical protein J2P45_05235 [Candidatus Dormibacteraeota bacterium]|nr:hypothetical protein [Candidatus Dormibacteraeota bacterium]
MTPARSLALVTACMGVAAVIVAAAGGALWLSGWPSRWLAEPLLAAVLAVLLFWLRDEWREHAGRPSRPAPPKVWQDLFAELQARQGHAAAQRRPADRRPSRH